MQSFFDKGINGIVIEAVEQFKPTHGASSRVTSLPADYYRWIMVILTGVPSVLILLLLLTILGTKYGLKQAKGSQSAVMAAH